MTEADIIGLAALGIGLGTGILLKLILDFIFLRKEFNSYFKDEWITTDDGKLDYKVNFWFIPIVYRPNPKALEEAIKKHHEKYKKAKAENPRILP